MNIRAYQYILFGQLALGLSILVCLLLIPHYFFSLDQGGISNYGTEDRTRPLFILGFGAASFATFIGSLRLSKKVSKTNRFQIMLVLLSLLYLTLMFSTFSYKDSSDSMQLHERAALGLILAMAAGAVMIRVKGAIDTRIKVAFYVFSIGFAIGLLTLFELVRLLFTFQIICGASFGYMLVRAVHRE